MSKRRKIGSKREDRRIYNKRIRGAVRREINGKENSRLIRPEKYSQRPQQPPLLEGKTTAYPQGRAKAGTNKNNGCPARPGNKRHHYLTDQIIVPKIDFYWSNLFGEKDEKVLVTYKLCAYCGQEKTIKQEKMKSI